MPWEDGFIIKNADIFENIDAFLEWQNRRPQSAGYVLMTSGGFDPLHVGHLQCIQESAEIAFNNEFLFVVILNGDSFLNEKKGYVFMPAEERAKIISAIRGVDAIVIFDKPGDNSVCDPIRIIKPRIFTKGGDRDSFDNIPEGQVCKDVGCRVIFNVGGGKIQSSSELVENAKQYE